MELKVFDTYEGMSRAAADVVIHTVLKKPEASISFASGHTSLKMFEYLVEAVKLKHIDFSHCTFIGLDEWLGIPAHQAGSCRNMMDQFFFIPAGIQHQRIFFFDGMSKKPEEEIYKINAWLSSHGPLDIMLVGIGRNGHLAMNEPGTPFNLNAHISDLAEDTILTGQKYFSTPTPLTKGLTLGLKQFQEAIVPILTANGEQKSAAIREALQGPVHEQHPASIVQRIDRGHIFLDSAAAKDLKR